jgi:hypothetical protein
VAYTACVLEAESHSILIGWMQSYDVPENFLTKGHHVTVDMKPAAKSMAASMMGQRHELKVIRFGRLDGIMAVEVDTVVPSKNERKHITLCHSPEVKPMMSNSITEWVDVEPFILYGVVQEVQ